MLLDQRPYERPEDVIRAILRRELMGLSVKAAVAKRDQHELFVAVIHHFRAWGSALRAAGIDAEAVSGRRTWTADRIVQEFHRLTQQGMPVNYASLRKADFGLAQAARKLHGSFENALIASGYDPDAIRRLRRPWTKSQVITAIQAQAAAGRPLTQNGMLPESARFAAIRLFGSFKAALRMAGVHYMAPKRPRWSRRVIVEAIHARRQSGEAVNCVAIVQSDSRLYDAARRYFGGWPGALCAAGLDPERIRRKPPPWTAQAVVKELKRRAATGQPATCISYIQPVSLVRACGTFFGSLEAAATAARVDPARIGYRRSQGRRRRRPVRGPAG